MKEDLELEQYRSLLPPPTSWQDGFNLKSVIGALFVGIVMMPASMYLNLLLGADLGGAAQWVTTILFVELARRSFTVLKRPEIFILFYMAGTAVSSPFAGLLWNQFYMQSDAARSLGIADQLPSWYAPGTDVLALRSFFHRAWLAPIVMLVIGQILGAIDKFGLGYVLFRVTSDVEKLPFPMAPVGALGVTALAESSSGAETWRWRVFSIGGMIGILWGFLYAAVPAITGIFLKAPITIIPIPFVDLTTNAENLFPAVPFAIDINLGNIILGMVLPFYAVVGSFLGYLSTFIINPILHNFGQLPTWKPNMTALDTAFANNLDVYLSVGIGIALAIAVIGFYHVFSSLRKRKESITLNPVPYSPLDEAAPITATPDPTRSGLYRLLHPPQGRGDIPLWIAIAIFLFTTSSTIALGKFLVPEFPLWVFLVYGFIYTPIISYVAARMEGIVGQWVDIPYVRETTFILAHKYGGYHGVSIWFAPIPITNYGGAVVSFRTQELTGTKFTSMIKAELVVIPIVLISSILFAQYLWRAAPIPSPVYPYANTYWEFTARNNAVIQSATLGGSSPFYKAVKWPYIGSAAGIGIGLYAVLASAAAPVMLSFGLVRGLGSFSPGVLFQMIGALLARYYFEKRFGLMKWREYAPVLLAGFACGVGLISMLALGCNLISKAVFQLPY